jgi:hypothetical protein
VSIRVKIKIIFIYIFICRVIYFLQFHKILLMFIYPSNPPFKTTSQIPIMKSQSPLRNNPLFPALRSSPTAVQEPPAKSKFLAVVFSEILKNFPLRISVSSEARAGISNTNKVKNRTNIMKNKLLKSSFFAPIAASLLLAAAVPATAATIVVENNAFNIATGFGPNQLSNTLANFTVTTGNKLVVAAAWEGSSISTITYGAQSLVAGVNSAGGPNPSAIWYLDNPTAGTADITVTFGANTNFGSGIGAMSLTNAAAGAPSFIGNAAGNSITYSTLEDNTLVVGASSANSGTKLQPLANTLYNAAGWSGEGAAGWSTIATAGSQTDDWFTGAASRPGVVVAGFTAIPEPSAAALLGIFGCLAALLRRRK